MIYHLYPPSLYVQPLRLLLLHGELSQILPVYAFVLKTTKNTSICLIIVKQGDPDQ